MRVQTVWPLEKQDTQVVDLGTNVPILLLPSLLRPKVGWWANISLQPTPVGALSCISHLSSGVVELGLVSLI